MPYVTISTSQHFPAEQKKQLLQRASDAVVESIGAPLAAVRVMLHDLPETHYLNGGQFGTDAVMFVVELIEGRTEAQKAALIAALSRVGNEITGLSEEEVRVRLIDFPKTDMGMAGGISAKAMGR
ncbi:tautomerase family protein [Allopusillimonas ginsengisoli]|uniref:tautomerase family protein n=1 Tax=Allopusillimonas ginsengisoli TaxID=453575 RepID=UPI001020A21A|nr:tautomerase family protein [Allopusillimonas ginsengisoli]TEA79451.1 tautomerase [Allopusillimonas ginsengisoli]